MHFRYLGEFPAEGGEFPHLFFLGWMIAEFPVLDGGLAVPPLFVLGEELGSVLEGPLGEALVEGGEAVRE